jgi:transcriptional regulator with GAF, ATPase, and Fis domain
VRRLGSTKERAVPARFIAATNRDLHEMSAAGRFRQDLYYRLNVMSIHMPPLRDREDDAFLLSKHFAAQTAKRYGLASPVFLADAVERIRQYQWPGNVRELRHQVSRAMLLSHQGRIAAVDLALPMLPNGAQSVDLVTNNTLADYQAYTQISSATQNQVTLYEAEKNILLKALAEAEYNVSKAARKLGITRMTMRYRMDKHQIPHK